MIPDNDPEWMHGDDYFMGGDDGFDPENRDVDQIEFDDMGNPIYLATAAGFGAMMAEEEILEERELAERILNEREGKQDELIKIPLSHRRRKKGHMTPFARWATKVNQDPDRRDEEIEYTMEEWIKIMRTEIDDE